MDFFPSESSIFAVKSLRKFISKQVGYLVHYKDNIDILKQTLSKMEDEKTSVQHRVDEDRRNLSEVDASVERWLSAADDMRNEVIQFLEDEIKRNRNSKSRYVFSKAAKKLNDQVLDLLQEAKDVYALRYPSSELVLRVKDDMPDLQVFGSRTLIIDQALAALVDDKVSIIGISGMGGTGKTTLAKKMREIIEERAVMDVVCMVVVSQTPDLRSIQNELADSLGLKLDVETLDGRAAKLRSRLMREDVRTLLILDDVLEVVDLKTIGIPPPGEANGVKILLTSRKEDVCNRMGTQRNFSLSPLTEEEALDLFKKSTFTGDNVDNQDMLELASEIVPYCQGLPVLIVAIASSLRNYPIDDWRDALAQLKDSAGISVTDSIYSSLKLSYDFLPTEEHKSCLLLCSLFPEDSSILIEDLVRYGRRLGLFGGTDNFFQAKERVSKLIDDLKAGCLLLDDSDDDSVTMHDVIRDFAISIASKDKSYVHCDDANKNLLNPDVLKSCKTMSLFCEETTECPVVLQCPNLEFLLFSSRRSSESVSFFFQGMKTGGLGNLVVLAIKTQSSPNLPEEIGLLTDLGLLDLSGMSGLKYVPPGVLSKLSKLNELYVTPKFRRWGSRVEGEDGERINASLTELEFLPIIALQIAAPDASILPKLHFFEKLVHCEIRLGNTLVSIGGKSNNDLVLEGDASDVKGSGICALVKKTQDLRLARVENFKSIIEHLIHDARQIPSSPDIQLPYFTNLTHLAIESCGDLKHVFTLSVARSLTKIQKIRISDCIKLEGIFYGEGEVEEVEFPCLTNLELTGNPNLNGFWVDIENAGARLLPYQSSVDVTATKSSTPYSKGASSSMEEPSKSIETKSSLVVEIGCVQSGFGLFPSWIRLSNLQELQLQGCILRVAFPSIVAEQLVKLKTLEIRWCWNMEYVVATIGRPQQKNRRSSTPNPVFPKLRSFFVDDLPELMAFSADNQYYLEWSSLDELKVSNCPKVKTLSSTFPPDHVIRQDELLVSTNEILFKIPRQLKGSMNVKLLEVRLCDNLTHLFSSRAAKFLTGLERMEIKYCEKLKEVVAEEGEEDECELCSLESVTFDGCFQLKTFSYNNSVSTPNLKDVHINGSKYEIIENVNTTIQKVMSSEARIFDMKELETIDPFQIPYQDTIRDLEIQGCDKLINAIPCNLIARLRKIEKLAVRWCDSLEQIFEYEGAIKFERGSDATFSHLEEITLFDLENLKHVFTSIPKTIIGFQKLRKLYVHGCHCLKNIFSVSSVRGLLELQELKISSCNGLKEIVAKDDKEEKASRDRIVFPKLQSIGISNAATLESFYSGIYDLVMPLVESLHLNQCPSIKKFSKGSLTAPKLQKVQGDCKVTSLIRTSPIADLDEIIANKKNRTQLRIYNGKNLHDQLPYGDLSHIHELEIQACDELLCAIPCNLKPTDLQKLEKLVVRRCHLLEEIFEHRGASFGSGSITTFSNLEEISLFDLGKLQQVFYNIPEATIHFQKLRKLHIHGCNSLSNIFSVSTVNGLPELQELKISSCDGLEEIVAQGEMKERGIKDIKIVFPQLRRIDIGYSPKLVCFYSGTYALELPLLESLFLYKCPYMLTFSNGLLTTPSQLKVQIDNGNYKLLEDDLNATMKYKDLLLQQYKNSQGLEEHQQDSEFASGSSAEHTAALVQEYQMLKQKLASMERSIAHLLH